MTKLHDAYYRKRVLVTGHTGFKGSWLTLWLKELGANVTGYALEPPTDPNNFEACDLKRKINHESGDICDLKRLLEVFYKYQPEIVFHLAAQSLVRRSYVDPKMTFDTNIGGTINILEAVRLSDSVRVFINVTSDKCYENREWIWGYRENDPMGGHDPYSASKGCAELVFSAYLNSYFSKPLPIHRKKGLASVRAGNVIGGGDWAEDRLIPDCVRAIVNNRTIELRSPISVRPWQHVLEPLSGYLLLGALLWEQPEKYNGAWNFGPTDEDCLTVEKVVSKFIELWGTGTWENLSNNQESVHEANMLKLCCDKATRYIGWHGTLRINECLKFTADWYKKFYNTSVNKIQMEEECLNQIREYSEKIDWLLTD